jgi:hypothetical protein
MSRWSSIHLVQASPTPHPIQALRATSSCLLLGREVSDPNFSKTQLKSCNQKNQNRAHEPLSTPITTANKAPNKHTHMPQDRRQGPETRPDTWTSTLDTWTWHWTRDRRLDRRPDTDRRLGPETTNRDYRLKTGPDTCTMYQRHSTRCS